MRRFTLILLTALAACQSPAIDGGPHDLSTQPQPGLSERDMVAVLAGALEECIDQLQEELVVYRAAIESLESSEGPVIDESNRTAINRTEARVSAALEAYQYAVDRLKRLPVSGR
jgi:hypothetical protein